MFLINLFSIFVIIFPKTETNIIEIEISFLIKTKLKWIKLLNTQTEQTLILKRLWMFITLFEMILTFLAFDKYFHKNLKLNCFKVSLTAKHIYFGSNITNLLFLKENIVSKRKKNKLKGQGWSEKIWQEMFEKNMETCFEIFFFICWQHCTQSLQFKNLILKLCETKVKTGCTWTTFIIFLENFHVFIQNIYTRIFVIMIASLLHFTHSSYNCSRL